MPVACQTAAAPNGRECFEAPFSAVAQSVEVRLRHSSYFELRSVFCECHEGVLTLQGRVPSYYLKQLAQALLAELPGVAQIDNRVEVVGPVSFQNPGWRESDSRDSSQVGFR